MPAKKSQVKQIEELREQLARQERLLTEKDDVIRGFWLTRFLNFKLDPLLVKLRTAEKAREFEDANRIPIPKGQAGRGDGYNLYDEMGVSKDTFLALRVHFF